MFQRIRQAVSGVVEGFEQPPRPNLPPTPQHKYDYMRPAFMEINDEVMEMSTNKRDRIILSSGQHDLPMSAGYAECINGGKSEKNEDMSQVVSGCLKCKLCDNKVIKIPYAYFAIFDGHAGFGAALDAYKQLHHIINQKLVNLLDYLVIAAMQRKTNGLVVEVHDLIKGCLETSFVEMDQAIKDNSPMFVYAGGCTALVVLFIMGNCYVANAGDCRAIACSDGACVAELSTDFSPTRDKERIYNLACDNPKILGDVYTVREFLRAPVAGNLGKNVLYREPNMCGWAYKTLSKEDLKKPLISGVGRRSRIMGMIGVARVLGDHNLKAHVTGLPIRPLLSSMPEIRILDRATIRDKNATLVMGSDGLWDVTSNEDAAAVCKTVCTKIKKAKHQATGAAQLLVSRARGYRNEDGMWLQKDKVNSASMDDISVFVIPLRLLLLNCYDMSEEECEPHEADDPANCGMVVSDGDEDDADSDDESDASDLLAAVTPADAAPPAELADSSSSSSSSSQDAAASATLRHEM